jgi:hypothetical protein
MLGPFNGFFDKIFFKKGDCFANDCGAEDEVWA